MTNHQKCLPKEGNKDFELGCRPEYLHCYGEIIPCDACGNSYCEYHEPREGHLRSCKWG